jgi:predicted aspartyl protease
MIRGRLVFGRPVVEARVVMPRLRIAAFVSFLVDTGADFSAIHPEDAHILGVDFLRDFAGAVPAVVGGVGGTAREFRETAILIFRHISGERDELLLELGVASPSASNRGLPSLLGRDALKHYRLTFQETASLVVLQSPGEL